MPEHSSTPLRTLRSAPAFKAAPIRLVSSIDPNLADRQCVIEELEEALRRARAGLATGAIIILKEDEQNYMRMCGKLVRREDAYHALGVMEIGLLVRPK